MEDDFNYIGFWKRVLATLIDCLIIVPIWPLTLLFQKYGFIHKNILPHVLMSLVWYSIVVFLVTKYGGTPGKLLLKFRIVDKNGNYLNWKKAVLRYLPLMSITIITIFQYAYAFRFMPDIQGNIKLLEMGRLVKEYSGPFQLLSTLVSLFYCADVIVIACNKKKRAIHDFLADSFVIEKKIKI
jgi:uncharacterized RDD family membrane protein YckC